LELWSYGILKYKSYFACYNNDDNDKNVFSFKKDYAKFVQDFSLNFVTPQIVQPVIVVSSCDVYFAKPRLKRGSVFKKENL